jgi:hypothetical protein
MEDFAVMLHADDLLYLALQERAVAYGGNDGAIIKDRLEVKADDSDDEDPHPLLNLCFASFDLADTAIRKYEKENKGRDLARLSSGHGANALKAVLVCKSQSTCPPERVMYAVQRKPAGWIITHARSSHGLCVTKTTSQVRLLRKNELARSLITATSGPRYQVARIVSAQLGFGAVLSKSGASRLLAKVRETSKDAADATIARLRSFAERFCSVNHGSLAVIEVTGSDKKMRTVIYFSEASGVLNVEDDGEGAIDGALKSFVLVPGTVPHLLRASNPTDSIDYGRLLYKNGGGIVELVTQVAGQLISLGMHYCQGEDVESWRTLLRAVRSVCLDVDNVQRSIISDRLVGAETMFEQEWGPQQNKHRLFCNLHLLLNLNEQVGTLKDPNLFWAVQSARNFPEYEAAMDALTEFSQAHAAYLRDIEPQRYCVAHISEHGAWRGGVRASRAEQQFARGKKNDQRAARTQRRE